MNKVILMGRLTRDPDVRATAGEKPMTYTTDIVVEEQEFAESKAAGNNNGVPFSEGGLSPADAAPADGFMNLPTGVEDEGLPFN